ncbi:MAG: radical SAM protein [Polyangiales bacterium]
MSDRAPWVLVPQWFGSILFERATARHFPFDHEITALLRRAVDAPIDASAVSDDRRAGFDAFVSEFYDRGLFTIDLRFDGEIVELTPPHGHLTGPLVTHLEVNSVCNLRCVHCFAGELPRKERPLELAELEALFRDMASIGALRLALSGGEPLMRKDLYELVDLAIAQGIRTSITTNGTFLDEHHARELARRDLLWLSVSLDGATRATNDAIRGSGVYDLVIERTRALRGRVPFSLAMTVTSTNAHEAKAFGALARSLGASAAVLRPLYPTGLAAQRLDLVPSFSQYRRALEELNDGASLDEGCSLDAEPYGPAQRALDGATVVTNLGCGAGTTLAAISASGVVSPCSFLGPAFDGPSVRDEPFSSIWNRSRAFQQFRSPTTLDRFDGGCRARALAHSGDAFATDPWVHAPGDRRHDPLVTLRARRTT